MVVTYSSASIVEKHFIFDRSMVDQIRLTEAALGTITYEMTPKKLKSRQFARSLYAVQDIAPGEPFIPENVRSIRPGFGAPPQKIRDLIKKQSAKQILRGQPIVLDDQFI